jgi:hypothetical protein
MANQNVPTRDDRQPRLPSPENENMAGSGSLIILGVGWYGKGETIVVGVRNKRQEDFVDICGRVVVETMRVNVAHSLWLCFAP